jgi:bifunctional non-homologous end joining protein LigD
VSCVSIFASPPVGLGFRILRTGFTKSNTTAIGCASSVTATCVRLITRNGYDWTKRYPWIAEAALKNRQKQFVIDGEAVILGVDGVSDFDALHSGRQGDQVQLYAFDMLAGDGDDMRALPLSLRKANLARLLARRTDGIFVAPFEQGEIGPDLFWAACNLGLEGLVSKRRDRPYRAGRSPHWIKVKNPNSPAMTRAKDVDWSR